jgi:hypothetical protein
MPPLHLSCSSTSLERSVAPSAHSQACPQARNNTNDYSKGNRNIWSVFLPTDGRVLVLSPSVDGTGLFCGVVKHLLGRGVGCPKVLIATHFHSEE